MFAVAIDSRTLKRAQHMVWWLSRLFFASLVAGGLEFPFAPTTCRCWLWYTQNCTRRGWFCGMACSRLYCVDAYLMLFAGFVSLRSDGIISPSQRFLSGRKRHVAALRRATADVSLMPKSYSVLQMAPVKRNWQPLWGHGNEHRLMAYLCSRIFVRCVRISCFSCQAASVIQKHWVEGELEPDVDDDPVARNQVIFFAFAWCICCRQPCLEKEMKKQDDLSMPTLTSE